MIKMNKDEYVRLGPSGPAISPKLLLNPHVGSEVKSAGWTDFNLKRQT
jgi:hypothetical protein